MTGHAAVAAAGGKNRGKGGAMFGHPANGQGRESGLPKRHDPQPRLVGFEYLLTRDVTHQLTFAVNHGKAYIDGQAPGPVTPPLPIEETAAAMAWPPSSPKDKRGLRVIFFFGPRC